MKYVSLLNTPFSGSTLVSMLLSSQPRVIGFGDTYFSPKPEHFPKHPCTCGKWYDECPPRVATRDSIHAGGLCHFEWPRATSVPTPSSLPQSLKRWWPLSKSASLPCVKAIPATTRKQVFSRFYRETELMVEGLENTGNYDVYIDGCKDLVRFELLRSAIPEIKILHMVRHPGAFLYHFHKAGDTRYDLHLKHWIRYNKQCRTLASRIAPENYFSVCYESIVQRPGQFIADIGDFLGLSDIDTTDPRALRRAQIHVIGNRMRESADRVEDYSNTWRGKLPKAIESFTENIIKQDDWLAALYSDTSNHS